MVEANYAAGFWASLSREPSIVAEGDNQVLFAALSGKTREIAHCSAKADVLLAFANKCRALERSEGGGTNWEYSPGLIAMRSAISFSASPSANSVGTKKERHDVCL